MPRLLTVDQIREIAEQNQGPGDYFLRDFITLREDTSRGLPSGVLCMASSFLWDMDAQDWVRPEDVPPPASPVLSASWEESKEQARYVRSDGAILGEVYVNRDDTFAVEIQTGWIRADDLYNARPVRLWTSMPAARAEAERVCRALGLAS